ncbi:MAG TPA: lipase maturation factor family protein, partial [Thermoanaerobaculia bacterium]|nr:lipase maturation factor family protein [Thermoanaerobaculia bacterium]
MADRVMFEQLGRQPEVPLLQRWFGPDVWSAETYSAARWLWLRALGCIFLSAFLSLAFRIHGLIGPRGLLPAGDYLRAVHNALGWKGYWLAPTLLWLNAGRGALTALVVVGCVASLAIIGNVWPRIATAVAMIAFLSFIGAAQDFASYQSDGMLMEGAFLTLFLAPRPSRAAVWLLRWEWFRIYFESGLVKILSGEPQWRNLTAMDRYYENGPLPTWLGWYVQQMLPHGFHAATAAYTLLVELFLCWLVFFGRRSRLALFALTTPLQLAIILTANYAFLNYLVLCLGVFLLDDRFLRRPNVGPALQPAPRVVLPALLLP